MASKYYTKFVPGGFQGYWCVFKRRRFLWDKKVSEFSVYVWGAADAQMEADNLASTLNKKGE